MTPELPGYRVDRLVRLSGDRAVFAGQCTGTATPVAIETLASDYPSQEAVALLRRESELAAQLADVPAALDVYDVVRYGSGNLALVTAPIVTPLTEELASPGDGLARDRAIAIALDLLDTLEAVHNHGIVHKAIAPHNIRLDQGSPILSGFGVASELDREHPGTTLPTWLEGPLAYLAPEQTGRMNRSVDYRADYYSLGVTLFELLTGRRPFEATTVLAWIQRHIGEPAPWASDYRADLDPAVDRIIGKLLAKDPERRYQSAFGLRTDLQRAREVSAASPTADFVPGEWDRTDQFLIPQYLYGRDTERAELMRLFEGVADGASELCLVHGYSGIGKSALVHELDQPLVRERGYLIQGKFDQFQRGEAYSALAHAFRGLVRQLLNESEADQQNWAYALQRALGGNGQLVVHLLPDLELLIGPQPEVKELPPAEAQNRFQRVFLNFVGVFATHHHPLLLFLDDLQWSDTPTLEMVQHLVTARETSHLLVIGAYRSNEVGPAHPLMLMLDGLRARQGVREIPLGPLDRDAVTSLVADALRTERSEVTRLAELTYEKAQGNPFFTTQILHALHDYGAIRYRSGDQRWAWDEETAYAAPVSDDVVTFMVSNLRQLPSTTQQVLELAACIGNRFDLRTLALIHDTSPQATATALLPALEQHAVVAEHSEYRLITQAMEADGTAALAERFNPVYRFQHDRIQQAAYALIDGDRRQTVHRSIGHMLLRHASNGGDERLIAIVGHLNEARDLIKDRNERIELARLNYDAGVRARRSAAYEPALEYLQIGEALLADTDGEGLDDLTIALGAEAQQAAYLTARFDEAEARMARLLAAARSNHEKAEFLASRTRQYATLGKMQASIAAAIEGLALLGVELTETPSQTDIDAERQHVADALGDRAIAELVDAAPMSDASSLVAMRLLMEVFPAAFLSGAGRLFPYLVIKAVNLCLRYGNCPEAAFAYAGYGMLLCGELDDPALGYEYGRLGLAINERFDDIALRSRVIYVYAMFIHHWSNHWSTLTPWFRKGIEAGYESGDLLYLAYSAQDCVIWDPTLDLETATSEHEANMAIVADCAYQDSLDSGTLFLQLQRNLMGYTDAPDTLDDATFSEADCLAGMHERGFMTGVANYHIYKAELSFLYGHLDRALAHIREQDALVRSAMSLPQLARYHIIAFLTRATYARDPRTAPSDATRAELGEHLAPMRRWAANCMANFYHLQRLMEAELAVIDGAFEEAMRAYEEAIEGAREQGFLRDEAMANERAAGYLAGRGLERAAEGYRRAAYSVYARWGAHRKVAQLRTAYPLIASAAEGAAPPNTDDDAAATALRSQAVDLASVMKASRLISGQLEQQPLMDTTMAVLLENAAAQWGCLVTDEADGFAAETVAGISDSGAQYASGLPSLTLIATRDGDRLPVPLTILHTVRRQGQPVVLDDATDSEFAPDPYVAHYEPRSVLCVPVQGETSTPIVYLENNLARGAFTRGRVEIIQLLAAQAAVAIEKAGLYQEVRAYSRNLEEQVAERTQELEQLNEELRRLADHDSLTGLANRRTLDDVLTKTWQRLRREQAPLSLVLVDIDAFKEFNDIYGHQAGDDCLVRVASVVNEELRRPGDMLARYGGEEFLIVLPNTDTEGAVVLAERVRTAVEDLRIVHQGGAECRSVTISAGVACCIPAIGLARDELVGQADAALYRAKAAGRNRVEREPLDQAGGS